MRQQLPPFAAPDLLRASVRAALRNRPVTPRSTAATAPSTPTVRRTLWVRQAAGLVIAAASSAITLFVTQHRTPSLNGIDHDVVATHVRSLMANHLTDIASTDQHNVKPWFNGKTEFSPEVYRLEDAGFPLIGGRIDRVGSGQPVAAIVYGRRQPVDDLFTWPEDGRALPTQPRPPNVATTCSTGATTACASGWCQT